MKLTQNRVAILLCSAAVVAFATPAFARPAHHHHHHHYRHATGPVAQGRLASRKDVADRDMRYPSYAVQSADAATGGSRRHGRRSLAKARAQAQSHANSAYGGTTTNSLVEEARKYIGTNPTGRGRLWCGAFMDFVLRRTGHPGGGNLALGYSHYGTRISGPQVGAIAVMGRRGGGHVGVVSGIDANGNPIIISGNHNHTTAESVYPRSRIAAYVVPGG